MEEAALLGTPFLWLALLVIPVVVIFGISKFARKQYSDDRHRDSAKPEISDVAKPYEPPKVQNKDEL